MTVSTKYVLRHRDTGQYYQYDAAPVLRDRAHLIIGTPDLELAKRFDGHSVADATALSLPHGREWLTVPIQVKNGEATIPSASTRAAVEREGTAGASLSAPALAVGADSSFSEAA